ncbi:MAG: hypothetical protein CVV10_06630 [Gammaproteobacteria bacterium HGW-Gammaproteobacteria-14]|nr:MAG: hypothetical protein CVV10_06630 [Gammaproteobacteria bacterium HGW-Gammaproteobacteria-14]
MRYRILLLGVALGALVACEPAPPPERQSPAEKLPSSEQRLLGNLLKEQQGERLRRLKAGAKGFADAVQGLLGNPDELRLATAREGWSRLYRSFNESMLVLSCRVAEQPALAATLRRIDHFPMLPGYIDGLQNWPDSGIVNDLSVELTRESLLHAQSLSSDDESSLGFQVVAFLLYGEPERPRTVAELSLRSSDTDDNSIMDGGEIAESDSLINEETVVEPPMGTSAAYAAERRREYLHLATAILVEDLLMLAREAEQSVVMPGAQCPVAAMRMTVERLIRVSGLDDHQSVSGEYYSAHGRKLALEGLQQGLMPWLESESPLRHWLLAGGSNGHSQTLPAFVVADMPDPVLLQQLHAALSAAR